MGFPDSEMTVKNSVVIPTVYTEGDDVLASVAIDATIIPMEDTSNFAVGDRVILGRGTDREEEGIIKEDGITENVSIELVAGVAFNHTVDAETTVDLESTPDGDNKILKVAATANFLPGETVLVDVSEEDEETYVIASVQAGDSLTMTEVLKRTHDATETVEQTGVSGVVEVCMASLSEVIRKPHHKNLALFMPADWTPAIISLTGCDTSDGTFNPIVDSVAAAEVVTAEIDEDLVVTFSVANRDAIAAVPFIQLRSGTVAAPVDQGAGNVNIRYVLTR